MQYTQKHRHITSHFSFVHKANKQKKTAMLRLNQFLNTKMYETKPDEEAVCAGDLMIIMDECMKRSMHL